MFNCSGTGDLNYILEEIEVTSSKICKLIDKGEKWYKHAYQIPTFLNVIYFFFLHVLPLHCTKYNFLKNTAIFFVKKKGKAYSLNLSFCISFFGIYQSLPEGYQQIEDVTVMNSSDFDRNLEDNEPVENSTDFDGFLEDDSNDESLTRIPVKEIEDVLVSSGVDKSEILHVFKMEGFKSPVKI